MKKFLVVVESPTKAKTISKILGKEFEVTASGGHIVDLPSNRLAVSINKGFIPYYRVIPGKEKIIKVLKEKAKGKEVVYLATDPDREGEAIASHVKSKLSRIVKNFFRVVFHEITENAVKEAFASPQDIDLNKVDAQKARRILDRIVGYFLSPFLWKKITRGLSAGRVQSVALKFIVEREEAIKKFRPEKTYDIEGNFKIDSVEFRARLVNFKDKKPPFSKKEEALNILDYLKKKEFLVKKVEDKKIKKKPPPPFTTSLLQQEAFNKLRFSAKKTMVLAQKLYEGVEISKELIGLITYMRTDSYAIAERAKEEIRTFIKEKLGKDFLASQEYKYKEKKGAQLAHEAIRPTSVYRTPDSIKEFLPSDMFKLYELIWKRCVASFMSEAIYKVRKIEIGNDEATFKCEIRTLLFEGFEKLIEKEKEKVFLPEVKEGERLYLHNIEIIEHTTKPPARFNDASLVKLLEEKGVGRPSTYAPTISTLIERGYIRREKGSFVPTELGIKVCNLLKDNFAKIVDEKFTAEMEEKLDLVEKGEIPWQKVLEDFYPSFKESIDQALKVVEKVLMYTDKNCPRCGRAMVIRWSRRGKFLSCSGYPECKYAEPITTDIVCPQCKEGKLVERRNKRGQKFYGCSRYPDCKYTTKTLPTSEEA